MLNFKLSIVKILFGKHNAFLFSNYFHNYFFKKIFALNKVLKINIYSKYLPFR